MRVLNGSLKDVKVSLEGKGLTLEVPMSTDLMGEHQYFYILRLAMDVTRESVWKTAHGVVGTWHLPSTACDASTHAP